MAATVKKFSIYEFSGVEELFYFIGCCKKRGFDVEFENENIFIDHSSCDTMENLKMTIYMSIKECPDIFETYKRYLDWRKENG